MIPLIVLTLIFIVIVITLFINKAKYYNSEQWNTIVKYYENDIYNINCISNNIYQNMNQYASRDVCRCSLSVLNNSYSDTFKYVFKYFGLESNETTLQYLKNIYVVYSDIERNFAYIRRAKKHILENVQQKIPPIIKIMSWDLDKRIHLDTIVNKIQYIEFVLYYSSPAGRSQKSRVIILDPYTISVFINRIEKEIEYHKTIKYQRSLMTDKLREKIKKRDNYTCQICGASIWTNPDIVFHIDHIKPISKGGETIESNLQTLCASCNLHKSDKYYG